MINADSSPLRILKGEADIRPYRGYLACPHGYPGDRIYLVQYTRPPYTVCIRAETLHMSYDCSGMMEHELDAKCSGFRYFLISKLFNREPGILITASGYDFDGSVEVRPWIDDFEEVRPVTGGRRPARIKEHDVDIFHVRGGLKKAIDMHKTRQESLEIDYIQEPEALEIYRALADFVPMC